MTVHSPDNRSNTMTKSELKKAKAELKRLNDFIAKHSKAVDPEIVVYVNAKNTEAYGADYRYVKIPKDATALRAELKAIRYGAKLRGKARWDRNEGAWSILADGLKGTKFDR
jgi:hypothetical protein